MLVRPLHRTRTRLLIAGTTLTCFLINFLSGMQFWSKRYLGGFDVGLFDQGMRGYARLELPVSIMKNYHHEFPPDFSLLGDHFSPIIALITPLYWIWDDPRMLLLGEALLFALGVPLVYLIGRRLFESPWAPHIAAFIYAVGVPLARASQGGFHEVGFAVPLLLLLMWAGLARNLPVLLVAALLLCATKEDLGLVVGAYGLLLILRGWKRPGVLLLIAGPVISLLAITWFIPLMGGVPGYYWSYTPLGDNPADAVRHILAQPWILVEAVMDEPRKPLLVQTLLLGLAFLPLGSGSFLLAVPLLAERLLSTNPNHWATSFHYDAFVWPILLVAAMETAARLPRKPIVQRLLLVGCAINVVFAVAIGVSPLTKADQWRAGFNGAALTEAAAMIPDGAFVEADNNIAPQLTRRCTVVLADQAPRGAEYVVLRTKGTTFPFTSSKALRERVDLLLANGYRQLWTKDGVYLLHRESAQPIPGMRVPGPGSTPVRDFVPKDVDRLYEN